MSGINLKLVADAPDRRDPPLFVIADLLAQSLDMNVDGARVTDIIVIAPELVEQLPSRRFSGIGIFFLPER